MKTSHLSVCLWLVPTLGFAQTTRPAENPIDAQIEALRAEIDLLLLPSGLPDDDVGVDQQLIEVAERSGELARSDIEARQQLDASNIELRAYNALANDALRTDHQGEASFRLAQLRSAAEEAGDIPADDAELTGAFWLLNADLIDINRNADALLDRQFQAIARLEAFLEEATEQDAAPSPIIMDVKLGLLQLYAQAGQSDKACALLAELEEVDDPRTEEAAAICERIGEPAGYDQHLGEVVLLTFYETAEPPDVGLPDAVVHERVAIEAETLEENRALLDRFAVSSLPWYVVVDRDGRIAAIGQSEAILGQIEPLQTNEQ